MYYEKRCCCMLIVGNATHISKLLMSYLVLLYLYVMLVVLRLPCHDHSIKFFGNFSPILLLRWCWVKDLLCMYVGRSFCNCISPYNDHSLHSLSNMYLLIFSFISILQSYSMLLCVFLHFDSILSSSLLSFQLCSLFVMLLTFLLMLGTMLGYFLLEEEWKRG